WGLLPVTELSEAIDLDDRAKVQGPIRTYIDTMHEDGKTRTDLDDRAKVQAPIRTHIDVMYGDSETRIGREWWDGEGPIYLIWAILNPNGPTLYIIGHKGTRAGLRVYFRWMHMLGGETTFASESRQTVTYDSLQEDLGAIRASLTQQGK